MDYISRIMAGARIRLTGVIDDALKLGMFETVDEFLRETNVWREEIPFVTIESDTGPVVYDLVPTKGTILRLIALTAPQRARQVGATMEVPGELILITPFDAGADLVATVSLAPLDPTAAGSDFPDIDTWIYTRFYTALIDGLIMKMASQPDKPYTSDNLTVYHGKRFRNAISVARADIENANIGNGQAWRFPEFAAQRGSSRQVN